MNNQELHSFITKTVREAGDLLLEKRTKGFSIAIKNNDPKSVVTNLDLEINELLTKKIQSTYPDHTIISEEADTIETKSNYTWIIDPIDGTHNFSRGIPHYAVVLGVMRDDMVLSSAVYNPVTKELFHFIKDGGAYLNDTPISVSDTTTLKTASVLFHAGRKKHLEEWGGQCYTKLLRSAFKSGNLSSTALDTCFVAAGRVEASIYGAMMTYDSAPSLGILLEAGGVYCDEQGSVPAFSHDKQKIYCANSQTLLNELLGLLEG